MSTLRISNIEAKADNSSPTVDEQLKFTNSTGDLMLYLDGRTSGITTVGINTTNQTIKFDENNNVFITGIVTATELHGTVAVGTSITYGDNEKAYFGTGLDLQIFHNNSDSVISQSAAGTGNLKILSGGAQSIECIKAGAVNIAHNGTTKFATTSTGATLDHTLTIGGAAGSPGRINFKEGGAVSEIRVTRNSDANSDLQFKTERGDGTVTRAKINYSGDFVVPSNKIGIGTDDAGRALTIRNAEPRIRLIDDDTGSFSEVYTDNTGHLYLSADAGQSNGGSRIVFNVDGDEKVRIDNNGYLSFAGDTNTYIWHPQADQLAITKGGGSFPMIRFGSGGAGGTIAIGNTTANLVTNSEILSVRGYSSFKSVNNGYAAIYTHNEGNTSGTFNTHILFNAGGANRGGFGYMPNTGELTLNHQYDFTVRTGAAVLGGTERLRIHSDGKISTGGITNPTGCFEVNTGAGSGQANTLALRRASSSDYSAVSFFTGTTCDWSVGQNNAGSFDVYEDGADASTRFAILSGGKVLIGDGNTTTSGKLNVKGNVVLDDGSNARLTLQAENANTNQILSTTTNFGSYTDIKYQAAAHKFLYGGNENFHIHANGRTIHVPSGDLLLGPDNVSQMEATIRGWGASLWFTTIDSNYYHDSGGEFRQFYNKGSFRGDNYLTCFNCAIATNIGAQNRNFWKGTGTDSRAEGSLDISVGYRGAFFFISRTSCATITSSAAGKYLFDRSSSRCSVSFDSFGNSINTGELSFHCGNTAGYDTGDNSINGKLGSSNSDGTERLYAVGCNMENYNAPNSKRAGNHLGISVINDDGSDYGSSRLSQNLINNGQGGGTNSATGEFNWGNRHSNDRGHNDMQFSQLIYFDDIQLNVAQWDYLEHYFKVMYGKTNYGG